MSQRDFNIAFVGAGNMAGSIIRGLLQNDHPSQLLKASAPSPKNTASLTQDFGIDCSHDNKKVVSGVDIVVLGVKPQILQSVCAEISTVIASDTLVISLAAGITCQSIQEWLGKPQAIVRCMSNTPAQILEGASGLYANNHVSEAQKVMAEKVIGSVGVCCWVENESLIDTVTAIAGSAPAYFFLFLEAMVDAACAQGMDHNTAKVLASQSALGAAKLVQASTESLEQLRANVTSPNGTTERAIQSFETHKLRQTVNKAMQACTERAQELAKNA